MVHVSGMAYDGGVIASTIRSVKRTYNPGQTRVHISGIVSKVDYLTGTVYIGQLSIDATKLKGVLPEKGRYVTFRGTQPQVGEKMLAE